MNWNLNWAALAVVAVAAVSFPAAQYGGNRSILYWIVVPSLFFGVAAIFTRLGAF